MAWDWIASAIDWLGETATNVLGEAGTDILTDVVVGAGVGALVSAVSDGDVGEGLLYGATGGLVLGGIQQIGKGFFEDFSLFGAKESAEAIDAEDWDIVRAEVEGIEGVPRIRPEQAKIVHKPDGAWNKWMGKITGSWGDESTAALLTIGGPMLAGAFTEDAEERMVKLKEREFATAEAQRAERLASQRAALGSMDVAPGEFAPGVSVAEQVKRRGLTGFSKEAAGVTLS